MHRSSPSDNDLLHAYATAGDQTAFAELVRRHGGLVYAAARRQHDGDHHRAEETTQRVFVELAKQASTLARHPALVAWLHQHTRWSASHLRQAEARRRERETATHEDPSMQLTSDEITPAWDQLAPLLDEAVAGLGETDRAALILRHFEGRSFAEVGEALGVSESAAQMRTARALEKLRSALARKGLVAGSAALAAVLASQAAPPLPATVANTVLQSVAALSAGGVLVGGSLVGVGFFSMQIVKISAVALVAAALVGGYVWLRPGAPATASTSSAPISETSSLTSSAALLPAATSARPGPDEWLDGFRKLFGLSQTELKARLAALGMPLSDRALERTLHHDSPERFMESLLGQLALFHPDRLLTHAIRQGADSAGAITLVDMIDKTWRRTRLESWTLGEPVVALMRTAFADDAALMENLDQLKRPYGSPRNLDPVARGAEVLRLPSGKRSEALMQLALDWPAERAREMAAWGKAHLKGKEREEFFSRLAYPAYASANPELAAQLFAALDDPELRKLAAPSVAATLIQYDRHAAALEVLASLDEKNRAETAKMIGKHWALRDPNEAVTWLNQLEGAEFDAALGGMFEHLPATTMRGALSDFGKDQLAPSQEMAILRGLSRTTSWTDVKTAAELIPDFYAARGYAPLAAPVPTDWEGTEAQRTRALQFDVAARTVWSLAQKQDVKAALAWTERVPWATPDDKLIAQAYALPETVEIYQRNSVLGPIRPWIDAQLADPAKRRTLEARISAGR